jgi:hypothetical protein
MFDFGGEALYLMMKLLHIFSVLIYGGFLFTDNLILMRMQTTLSPERYNEVRSYFRAFTKALVPKALIMAVVSGIYLFYANFGAISADGLSNFQILLAIKATLGMWLGVRGVLQVFFGIEPFVFKSHRLPFILVVTIVFLSQLMWAF